MSVHGEYSRALESMIDRLRSLEHPRTEAWIVMFEGARVGSQPDLSAAAREALRVLSIVSTDPNARSVAGLQNPRERLEAHCRAILGS